MIAKDMLRERGAKSDVQKSRCYGIQLATLNRDELLGVIGILMDDSRYHSRILQYGDPHDPQP